MLYWSLVHFFPPLQGNWEWLDSSNFSWLLQPIQGIGGTGLLSNCFAKGTLHKCLKHRCQCHGKPYYVPWYKFPLFQKWSNQTAKLDLFTGKCCWGEIMTMIQLEVTSGFQTLLEVLDFEIGSCFNEYHLRSLWYKWILLHANSSIVSTKFALRYISFSKPRMLSAQGRCFTFDASADGYARGEGAGAVLLRLPSEAQEAAQTAEQPLATLERCGLLGVAVNQDTDCDTGEKGWIVWWLHKRPRLSTTSQGWPKDINKMKL